MSNDTTVTVDVNEQTAQWDTLSESSSLLAAYDAQGDKGNLKNPAPTFDSASGGSHRTLPNTVLMQDGWQLRPISSPGSQMMGWDIGERQVFFNGSMKDYIE